MKFQFNYFKNWDTLRFGAGLELLYSFVDGVERDCDADVKNYDASTDEGHWEGDPEDGGEWVHVHRDLDNRSWDLNDVFHNYFPTLRRGSTLAMLCSFFEHELNDLCNTIQKYQQLPIAARDLHGQGIERAMNYLKLCGSLELPQSKHWEPIKRIYEVRNALVHAGGHATKEQLQKYVKAHVEHLELDGTEIVIRVGYLHYVIDTFRAYGKELGDALRARFP